MKSGHYIAIFIAVVVIVGGVIVYNARTITEMPEQTVQTSRQKNIVKDAPVAQKKIDVMKDADIENDVEDTSIENDVDVSDVEGMMDDESVSF